MDEEVKLSSFVDNMNIYIYSGFPGVACGKEPIWKWRRYERRNGMEEI